MDVTELVAAANEACGANVAKLKELMDKIAKLSEVLEINTDCTGMTQTNIHRAIKHAAKNFLSTIHGRTRNKLRKGAKIVQKAGDAIIQGIR
jgi:TusA-related sulfurtransferase